MWPAWFRGKADLVLIEASLGHVCYFKLPMLVYADDLC